MSLRRYGAASRPENDVSASGGAIDTACVLDVTQMASTGTLEAVSTSAADTMVLTITGRDAAGAIVSQGLAMTGATVKQFPQVFERFLKASLATPAVGDVTIRMTGGGATVAVIPAGKAQASVMFLSAASEAAPTARYEKEFWKNENESLTLTNAKIMLAADPSASIRVGCEAAKNGSQSVPSRKTLPGSVTFVDDSVAQAIPGGQLEPAAVIGVWVEMSRGAAAPAIKTSFTTRMSGMAIGSLIVSDLRITDAAFVPMQGDAATVLASLSADNVYTPAVSIRGYANIWIQGTWSGVLTLQATFDGGATWNDVNDFSGNTADTIYEAEFGIEYRIGFKPGSYGSGTAMVRISQ